jgi:hypothetical protein
MFKDVIQCLIRQTAQKMFLLIFYLLCSLLDQILYNQCIAQNMAYIKDGSV